MQTPYTYVFIRTDIPLAAQLVQAAHAALERGFRTETPDKTSFLIMLSVKNEQELKRIKDYLDSHEIESYMFYEPDYDMGYTSICAGPVYGDQRKVFKKFKLWKA